MHRSDWDTAALRAADKRHIWHPFTPMGEWCAADHDPIVLVEGRGALLWDSDGREYIDGNSSIWTNIHGHNHPHINAAIRRQLDRVAHTSFLGFTNPAAIELAQAIVALFPPDTLTRVFFSDDGSTGIEVALRIVEQYWRLSGTPRNTFIAFRGGYHGDTAGAASLGASAMFNGPSGWHFPARQIGTVAELESLSADHRQQIAAVVIEPLVQGAAGMKLWPNGTLAALREWCNRTGALLIADEVLTGFGRTGRMFACEHEEIIPDLIVLGKALSGGYVPLALTVTTEKVFKPFSGAPTDETTLFYGHSYTGNAVGCAAAKASLDVFEAENVLGQLEPKIRLFEAELTTIAVLPFVQEVRQIGFIAAVDVRPSDAIAAPGCSAKAICRRARDYGLLTRPIRDTVVLMPPFCISEEQLKAAVAALRTAILDVCGAPELAETRQR
ncbi:MAG TPA: adenosylmethionine--8-amino-7-oxononanoate transaminase [Chthoniobacterales bacterium]|nr:adenosylmethionine--8-amino-7-oxononanoate transaminase [Chthoniobacterales bacterium]